MYGGSGGGLAFLLPSCPLPPSHQSKSIIHSMTRLVRISYIPCWLNSAFDFLFTFPFFSTPPHGKSKFGGVPYLPLHVRTFFYGIACPLFFSFFPSVPFVTLVSSASVKCEGDFSLSPHRRNRDVEKGEDKIPLSSKQWLATNRFTGITMTTKKNKINAVM